MKYLAMQAKKYVFFICMIYYSLLSDFYTQLTSFVIIWLLINKILKKTSCTSTSLAS